MVTRPPSGKEFITRYRKGSKPEVAATKDEIQGIFEKLKTSLTRLEHDAAALDFSNFREYPTSYGYTLRSVDEALEFNNLHEAMHIGSMIALRKFV